MARGLRYLQAEERAKVVEDAIDRYIHNQEIADIAKVTVCLKTPFTG